jgi:hypothetical protein
MRRALTAAALLVLAAPVIMSLPAIAQDSNGYSGGWVDPAPTDTTNDTPLAYLTDHRQLSGALTRDGWTIDNVSFLGVPSDDPPPDGCAADVPEQTAGGGGSTVTFAFDATFPCNLEYLVRATAHLSKRQTIGSATEDYAMPLIVAVAIPPAPVEHVDATLEVDGDDRRVTLEWPAGAEPDLLGYVVTRDTGSDTETLGQVDAGEATRFVDKAPPAGSTTSYSIVAVRDGPDDAVEQVPSSPTTVSVNVPASSQASSGASGSGGSESGLTTVVTGQPARGQPDASSLSSVRARGGSGRPSGPPTTIDTGFEQTLPFQPGDQSAAAAPPPSGDPAVVAIFDEGGSGSPLSDERTMKLIAAGLVVLVFASTVLVVTRRAARDAY